MECSSAECHHTLFFLPLFFFLSCTGGGTDTEVSPCGMVRIAVEILWSHTQYLRKERREARGRMLIGLFNVLTKYVLMFELMVT